MNEQPTKTPLPIAVQPEPPAEPVPIELDKKAQKKAAQIRRARAKAELRFFRSNNVNIIHVKNKLVTLLGGEVEDLGVKRMAYGKWAVAANNTDMLLARCDTLLDELMSRNPPVDPGTIIELIRLQSVLNQQIMENGQKHMDAVKSADLGKPPNGILMPFPSGQQTAILVSTSPPKAIEDVKPQA